MTTISEMQTSQTKLHPQRPPLFLPLVLLELRVIYHMKGQRVHCCRMTLFNYCI